MTDFVSSGIASAAGDAEVARGGPPPASDSPALYEELLEATSDCVFLIDAGWRITYLNRRAAARITEGGDPVGRDFWEFFPALRGTAFETNYRRAMAERVPAHFEAYYEPSDNWYEVQVSPLSSGGIGIWFRSVSDRREADRVLREREAHLAVVFGQARVGIIHRDSDGRLRMVNPRYCEIVGRSEEELASLSFADYTHPDDLPRNLALFEAHLASGEPYQIEKRYLRPDGSVVWCQVSVSFVKGPDGTVSGTIAVAEDVTARKAAEEELARQSGLLRNIADSVADIIFVKDRSGTFVFANRALDEGCGELVGRRDADVFSEDRAAQYRGKDEEVMATGETQTIEEEIPIDGVPRMFQTVKVPWVEDGEVAGIIGVSRDITERKAAETALRESAMLHRSVLEASADCIKIVGLDGRLEFINGPGMRAMELPESEDFRGRPLAGLWPGESVAMVEAALAAARGGEVARITGYCPTARGEPKWWDVLISPMSDEEGRVVRLLVISRDITAQRETAEKLRWASEHDALTSLPNRRAFEAHLQAATIRAMESGATVGLLLMDVDRFKHVNDTLGHAAGDQLLAAFGERLRTCVRAGDFVARLGGDEFAIVLGNVHGEQELVRVGDSVLARLKAPVPHLGRMMNASASIGGALFPRDAKTAHELFNNADTALYALKESGRGGTKMFHQHLREQVQRAASELSMARIAISGTSVEPHYQPKVELGTGRIVGFEALLRWRHPHLGIQHPETVAEAFKDYELAAKIGELMQRRVLADVAGWLAAGIGIGPVSINASPAEFLRDDFAERLFARLAEFEVPPEMIEIEVTEHVFLERGSAYVHRALDLLDEAGVRIALDDFGTGYSSLSHLRDFPVDVVKIDRSFVAKMAEEEEIGAIVSAVIDLAESLDIDVVAEGVETEEAKDLLYAAGCNVGQGFLFGRAVEAAAVPALIEANGDPNGTRTRVFAVKGR